MLLLAGGAPPAVASAQAGPPAAGNDCPTRWRRHASSDSTVTICLPAGFVRREDHTWMRPSRTRGAPPIEEVLKTMRDRAARFNVDKIKQSDLANMGGAQDDSD
jgi:hypothetical protein